MADWEDLLNIAIPGLDTNQLDAIRKAAKSKIAAVVAAERKRQTQVIVAVAIGTYLLMKD